MVRVDNPTIGMNLNLDCQFFSEHSVNKLRRTYLRLKQKSRSLSEPEKTSLKDLDHEISKERYKTHHRRHRDIINARKREKYLAKKRKEIEEKLEMEKKKEQDAIDAQRQALHVAETTGTDTPLIWCPERRRFIPTSLHAIVCRTTPVIHEGGSESTTLECGTDTTGSQSDCY